MSARRSKMAITPKTEGFDRKAWEEYPNPMTDERRRRSRLNFHCGIQLCRVHDHVIVKTQTDNLSVEGFYCTSEEPFSPGDRLECELLLPKNDTGFRGPNLVLHRRVRVLRVEIRGLEPGFGVACQFEDECDPGD
jgi:hypothetical protein